MSQDRKIPWKELGRTRLLLLAAAAVGLLLLAWPGQGSGSDEVPAGNEREAAGEEAAAPQADYAEELETRLSRLLSSMDGVGGTEVMITLKSSGETILQTDSQNASDVLSETDADGGTSRQESYQTEQSTVLTGSGSSGEPYVIQTIMPQVEGIVVICEGGGDPAVKAEITEAVSALFDIPAHKIKVLKRVSGKS